MVGPLRKNKFFAASLSKFYIMLIIIMLVGFLCVGAYFDKYKENKPALCS